MIVQLRIEEFIAIFRCKGFFMTELSWLIFTALIPGSRGPVYQEQMGFLPSQCPKIYLGSLTVVFFRQS